MSKQIDAGHFKAAETAIAATLAQPGITPEQRTALEFERERMRRILIDFTLDADAVKARLRKQIPDLTDAEFARWDAAGLLEKQVIDGRTLYFKRSAGNLFRISAEARARRKEQVPFDDGPNEVLNDHHRAVREAALASHSSSVLPRRESVTQILTVKADAVPAGETIRAWIPYPRAIVGQQEDIRLTGSEPSKVDIAPESALQRTAYLEKKAEAGKPTEFSITYELTLYARYVDIDPARVTRTPITPELGAVCRRARAAYRLHRRHARVLEEAWSAARRILIASRRSCSPPWIRFRGRVRVNTPRSPTSATTRCMPGMAIAASRRCC